MTTREQNRDAQRRYRQRYGKAYTVGYRKAQRRALVEFRRLHPEILDEECGSQRAAEVARRAEP